jgi:hypothetical protein
MLNTSNATSPIPVNSVASATESYSSQCQYVSTMSIRCSNAISSRSAKNRWQTNGSLGYPPTRLTASRMSGSGPKILILRGSILPIGADFVAKVG